MELATTDDGDALQSRQVLVSHARRQRHISVTSSVSSYELPNDGFRTPPKAEVKCMETVVEDDADADSKARPFE